MDCDRGRILIVEDEEDIRDLLCTLLQRESYETAVASSAASALELVFERPFDLVLLDIGLPDVDGFEVLARVRRERPATQLPVIMVTGLGGRADVVRALQAGANDYVTKPLDLQVVLARVQTQLAHKQAVDLIVELEHDLARRNRELEAANRQLKHTFRQMKQDLESAAMVQQALLPTSLPETPGVDFTWTYRPCQELAGDILNVFQLDDDHVGMYLLDVSGHGVRAALLSVTLSRLLAPVPHRTNLVRKRSNGRFEATAPREVAEELNRRFQFDMQAEQYFTLFYGVLNVRSFELRYVSAGQPGPVYAPLGGEPRDLTSPVFAIGWVPEPNYQEQRLQLAKGDRVYLYSDGLDEVANDRRERFGKDRLVRTLWENRDAALSDSVVRMVSAAEAWAARPFDDDVSALAIEIRG